MFDSPCSFNMNAVFAITLYFFNAKKAFLWLERDITTRCLHNACSRNVFSATKKNCNN